MYVTFVCNFMNHHQLPFSKKMFELTNGQFTYVEMDQLPEEQAKLGYQKLDDESFILKAFESKENYDKALKLVLDSDIVIFGSCPNEFIDARSKTGKKFIIYSERFFKKGTYRRFVPTTLKKIYDRTLKFKNDDMAIICSSAYLPYDLNLLHSKQRTLKWGYFPIVKKYDDINNLISKKVNHSILWVGRFVDFKHPETPVLLAEKLKKIRTDFQINIIGCGGLEEKVKKLIKEKNLNDKVKLLGSMSTDKVRSYMEQSQILLLTSDIGEGWGAALNESMNSACAVIASNEMGSTPYLIKHNINGLVYNFKSLNSLLNNVTYLLDNPEKTKEMGLNAYNTMINEWAPEVATERLYNLSKQWLETGKINYYDDGPCSKTEIVKPNYKELINRK